MTFLFYICTIKLNTMKKYYSFTCINYDDYSDEEVWQGQESYESLTESNDEISAIKKITEKALKLFRKDFSENTVITGLDINTFYETTEDARL